MSKVIVSTEVSYLPSRHGLSPSGRPIEPWLNPPCLKETPFLEIKFAENEGIQTGEEAICNHILENRLCSVRYRTEDNSRFKRKSLTSTDE